MVLAAEGRKAIYLNAACSPYFYILSLHDALPICSGCMDEGASALHGSRLGQVFPADSYEALLAQELAEGLALDEVEVGLSPGGAPIGVIPRRAAHLLVVPGEVQDELVHARRQRGEHPLVGDRKSTRLNSSHTVISYAVFCLKKKKKKKTT